MYFRILRQLPVLYCILCSVPAIAAELDLQTVLDRTMISPPSRVGFREVRHNRLLKDDLVITGFLEYVREGALRKVIESPFEVAYLIQDNQIEIDRGGVTKTLSLKKSRSLRTMLGGIEALLAGQADQLNKVFHSELSGVDDDWSLQLRPRSKRIAKQLTGLTVTGNGESITTIRFDLQDGEWHYMEIQTPEPAS